jgi:hypothetical protein
MLLQMQAGMAWGAVAALALLRATARLPAAAPRLANPRG